jgi:RND family efflux transporter MFP subunit
MKRRFPFQRRTLGLAAVLLPVLALFIWLAVRSGPMAPVPVVVAPVQSRAIAPAVFGIGTVQARYVHRIGPTTAGRVMRVDVQVGDAVKAGQVLGEIDPVDFDDRLRAQRASIRRAEAAVLAAEAQVEDAGARAVQAEREFRRYEKLVGTGAVSEEMFETRGRERDVTAASERAARANLDAARDDLARVRADRAGVERQRGNLRLVAPVDGLVTARDAEAGTTVVAGQPVIEVIDPTQLWIDVRFDQASSAGLRAGLPARVVLRSRPTQSLAGRVLRVEPRADAVTEEILAKVVIDIPPQRLPPLGELAEVTASLPALPADTVVPNASVQRHDGVAGVWLVEGDKLRFRPVKLGATDREGRVQVLEGLGTGDRVVVYSERALAEGSRFKLVERLTGVSS